MPPLVSVIIPCYRQAQYLREAVDSVLAQTYSPVEVIVVNDGSDDNTEEVAKSYGDRIRYVYRDNGGLSAARNTGLEHAHGEYVVFLDADDLLLPKMIEQTTALIRPNASSMIVHCGWYFCDAQGKELPLPMRFVQEDRPMVEVFGDSNPFPVHAVLCPKKPVMDAGGFDESLKACEDWDLWARLARLPQMQFIACREHLVKYRLTPASMSKSGKRMWDAANTILKRYSAPTQIRLASQYWGGVGVSLEIGKGTTPDVRSVLEESLGMHGPAPDYRRFAQGFLDGITRATGKTDLLSDELAVVCPDLCRLGLVAETEYHLPGLLYALVQIMLTKEAMKKVEESCRQAEEFRQQADESRRQAEEFRREAIRLTRMVEAYKTSRSYRIGRVITRMWPFPAWKPKSR